MAIAALVLGIVGAIFAFIPVINFVGIVLAIAGLVLGIVALVRSKKTGGSKGMAIAGVALSGVGLLVGIIMAIITALAVNVANQVISQSSWEDAAAIIQQAESWEDDLEFDEFDFDEFDFD